MIIFGNILRALRIEKGLTQSALGKILNVSRGAIYGWETDKQEPSLDNLTQLSKFFGVSTDYLLGLEDDFGNEINSKQAKHLNKKTEPIKNSPKKE